MLRRVIIVALSLSLSLTGCGRNVPKGPTTQTSAPNPPTVATPAPSSQPAPTHPFKWTDQQLNENTVACADAGSTDISYQSWTKFCRCAYEEAARRWTFEDFQTNFDARYETLFNDGIIEGCLRKAEISLT